MTALYRRYTKRVCCYFFTVIGLSIYFNVPHVLADELIIGVEEINYYPYYHVKDGEYQGFSRDLFDEFSKQSGYKVIYRPMPIKRLYEALLSGEIDFKFPDNVFWQQDLKGDTPIFYSDSIVGYIDGVLVKKEHVNLREESFTSVGYVRGFNPWTLMDQIAEGKLQARETNSLSSLLLLTLNERIDGAYFNIKVAQHLLNEQLGQNKILVFTESLPHDKTNYRMSTVKPEKRAIIHLFNRFLNSEVVKLFYEKYDLGIYE